MANASRPRIVRVSTSPGSHRGLRAVGQPDRQSVLRGEGISLAGVVVVFVGNEDAADVGGHQADTRKPPLGFARRQAAVEQDPCFADFGDQAIALGSAPDGSETQRHALRPSPVRVT